MKQTHHKRKWIAKTMPKKITNVVLTVVYNNTEYKLIEVENEDGWLYFPDVYIVFNNTTIELGNYWKYGINEANAHIKISGKMLGQRMMYDTYTVQGDFIDRNNTW